MHRGFAIPERTALFTFLEFLMTKLSLGPAIAGMIASLTLSLAATSASAVEAEQWNPPAGSLTRAQVVAELRAAQASGQMNNRNEAYDGTNYRSTTAPASTVSRRQVQAEGTAAMQQHKFNSDYVY